VTLPKRILAVDYGDARTGLAATDWTGTICGKMRKRFVRLTVGDRVQMEMSPYDLNKGRITWRLR
jgi:hypothetical protein